MQFKCVQTRAQQEYKYTHLSLAVTTGSLLCLLFTFGIKYLFQKGKIQQLEWDMSTITAGDYTVTFDILKKNYKSWLEESYEKDL